MLWTLIEKEIRNNLLNMRFVVAFFATTVLLVGSAVFVVADYVAARTEYDLSRNLYESSRQGRYGWGEFSSLNFAARQPQVLSVFAMGSERSPDNQAHIAWSYSPHFRSSMHRSPLPMVFAPVDLAFIVGVVISLLVFMLTFDAVSGEREQGVLRLLLASPLPRDTVILGKWLGGFISLLLPFLPSVVLVLLVLLFTPDVTLTTGHWLRIGAILGALLLYLATVFSLSMLVSCLHKRSGTVALSLLVVWVLMAIVLPGLGVQAAHAWYAPEGVRVREVAAIGKQPTRACTGMAERNAESRARFQRLHGDTPWHELTQEQRVSWLRWSYAQSRGSEGRSLDSILEISNSIVADDVAVAERARWLTRLSPFSCMQNICITLAGTGIEHEHELYTSLSDHCRTNYNYYRDKLYETAGSWGEGYNDCPRYHQPVDQLSTRQGLLVLDAGILALMCLLFFLAAYARFLNMSVV